MTEVTPNPAFERILRQAASSSEALRRAAQLGHWWATVGIPLSKQGVI
jgi:alkanesulfonate monooxygenase SsuD/methylene tetrahydromethanopterin reductase-like flavin-dependent oxidoreductase (luciferase family)